MMDSISLQTAVRDSSLDTATANTLTALYPPQHPGSFRDGIPSSLPIFVPSVSTLVAASCISPPDSPSLQFMHQLVSGAQATATSNFYDSLIAGPFSESANGEFTDIGVWLGRGDYQMGQENAIFAALGLEEWTRCPNARMASRTFEVPQECSIGFASAYHNLKDVHCFCVSMGGVITACVLLGEMQGQWCGLVSIAITPD